MISAIGSANGSFGASPVQAQKPDQTRKATGTNQDEDTYTESADGANPADQPVKSTAAGAASTSNYYDPADLNYDGTVTAAERVAYALQQYEKQKEAAG